MSISAGKASIDAILNCATETADPADAGPSYLMENGGTGPSVFRLLNAGGMGSVTRGTFQAESGNSLLCGNSSSVDQYRRYAWSAALRAIFADLFTGKLSSSSLLHLCSGIVLCEESAAFHGGGGSVCYLRCPPTIGSRGPSLPGSKSDNRRDVSSPRPERRSPVNGLLFLKSDFQLRILERPPLTASGRTRKAIEGNSATRRASTISRLSSASSEHASSSTTITRSA